MFSSLVSIASLATPAIRSMADSCVRMVRTLSGVREDHPSQFVIPYRLLSAGDPKPPSLWSAETKLALPNDTIPDQQIKTDQASKILEQNVSLLRRQYPHRRSRKNEIVHHLDDFILPISDPVKGLRNVSLPLEVNGRIAGSDDQDRTFTNVRVLLSKGYYRDEASPCPALIWYDRNVSGLTERQKTALKQLWDLTAQDRNELLRIHPFLIEQEFSEQCLVDGQMNFSQMLIDVRQIVLDHARSGQTTRNFSILISKNAEGFPVADLKTSENDPFRRVLGEVNLKIRRISEFKISLDWDPSNLDSIRADLRNGVEKVLSYLKACSENEVAYEE